MRMKTTPWRGRGHRVIPAGLMRCIAAVAVMAGGLMGTGCILDTSTPGNLVPATAEENPDLPSARITVAGHERTVHVRTFGDPAAPELFVLPGSISDLRAYLPLECFADRYHVVMWDLRGNGLSERVTRDELAVGHVIEEIRAMKEIYSPGGPVTLMGHSWSAIFAARYAGVHPGDIDQLILMEPFGLKDEFMKEVGQALNLFTEGYLDMMYSRTYLTARDHETLDYAMLATLESGVRDFHCGDKPIPPWPIRRAGGFALIVWEASILSGTVYDYDFTEGLESLPREVLLVGSSCSPLGYRFQERYNATVFPDARVLKIENAGHRIITEQFAVLRAGIQDYLEEYP